MKNYYFLKSFRTIRNSDVIANFDIIFNPCGESYCKRKELHRAEIDSLTLSMLRRLESFFHCLLIKNLRRETAGIKLPQLHTVLSPLKCFLGSSAFALLFSASISPRGWPSRSLISTPGGPASRRIKIITGRYRSCQVHSFTSAISSDQIFLWTYLSFHGEGTADRRLARFLPMDFAFG